MYKKTFKPGSWIIKNTAKLFLAKFRKQYKLSAKQELPIILVAGNIGKSSQTMLLNQLFESAEYKVWSGTDLNHNRNTLAGLIMTLGEFEFNLESASNSAKFIFLMKAFLVLFLKQWQFGKRPHILIFEIGVDHQTEMQDFTEVFKQVGWVCIPTLGAEHLAGFQEQFDRNFYNKLQPDLPKNYLSPENVFGIDSAFSNVEKNCFLEQLKLLKIAENYIIPSAINLNQLSCIKKLELNKQPEENTELPVERINQNLKVAEFITPDRFLLPRSFARQILIGSEIASFFKFSPSLYQHTLNSLSLPNGRFGFFDGVNQTKIIDGSYNSDPVSLESFINLLQEVNSSVKNYLVLGEMRELGTSSSYWHQKIIDKLENTSPDLHTLVLLLGTEWLKCNFNTQKYPVFKKAGEIVNFFEMNPPEKESWIWVKGSQNTIFLEIVVESLLLNSTQKAYLTRRGEAWNKIREDYT